MTYIHTPKMVSDEGALFLVSIRRCPICHQWMVHAPDWDRYSTFPGGDNRFVDQAERAGLRLESGHEVDGINICQVCKDTGKATFVCALCGERRPANQEEESFGDPIEYLCRVCYATVPAKEWDEKIRQLEQRHRHDWD
jgi:hypothetical protein